MEKAKVTYHLVMIAQNCSARISRDFWTESSGRIRWNKLGKVSPKVHRHLSNG